MSSKAETHAKAEMHAMRLYTKNDVQGGQMSTIERWLAPIEETIERESRSGYDATGLRKIVTEAHCKDI